MACAKTAITLCILVIINESYASFLYTTTTPPPKNSTNAQDSQFSKMRDVRVTGGDTFTFLCTNSNNSVKPYGWTKNTEPVPVDHWHELNLIYDHGNSIVNYTVIQATRNDSGHYRCNKENLYVHVRGLCLGYHLPEITYAVEHKNVTLTVPVFGLDRRESDGKMVWDIDPKNKSSNVQNVEVVNNTLKITNVTASNMALYGLQVLQDGHAVRTYTRLVVNSSVKSVDVIPPHSSANDSPTTTPAPTHSSVNEVPTNMTADEVSKHTPVRDMSTKTPEGEVSAKTPVGEVSTKNPLDDVDEISEHSFVHVHVDPGEPVKLECKPTSGPDVNITWSRTNGADLLCDTNCTIANESLTIHNASKESEGEYVCESNGKVQLKHQTARITLNAPPGAMHVVVTELNKSGFVNVTWKRPENGGHLVTEYVIHPLITTGDFLNHTSKKDRPRIVHPKNKNWAEFGPLVVGREYKFEMWAKNKLGDGAKVWLNFTYAGPGNSTLATGVPGPMPRFHHVHSLQELKDDLKSSRNVLMYTLLSVFGVMVMGAFCCVTAWKLDIAAGRRARRGQRLRYDSDLSDDIVRISDNQTPPPLKAWSFINPLFEDNIVDDSGSVSIGAGDGAGECLPPLMPPSEQRRHRPNVRPGCPRYTGLPQRD